MEYENDQSEWKESWSDRYLKTLAAFYNTSGGLMIIGRKDDGSYIGLTDPKSVAKIVSDSVRNKLHIKVEVSIKTFDGHDCVCVYVPKGDKIVPFEGRFYMRMGNTTQEYESDELKKVLLSEMRMQWLDQESSVGIDGLSAKAVDYFVSKGKAAGRIPQEVDPSNIKAILNRYGMMSGNRVTMTAALLFSEQPHLLNYGAYARIGLFDAQGILIRGDDVKCPLVELPELTVDTLLQKYIFPLYEYSDYSASVLSVREYPGSAIRELVTNAIVHMDYSKQRPVTIAVFPDRIRIFCAGGLPRGVTLESLKVEHDSIRRNSALASVFFSAGFIEAWGQGISKAMKACADNGNPEPEFYEMSDGLAVSLFPRRASAPDVADGRDIGERMLDLMRSDPRIRIKDMAEALGVSDRAIRYRLTKMKSEGVVTRSGGRNDGLWIVAKPGRRSRPRPHRACSERLLGFPQESFPSGQGPLTHGGPASLNMTGETSLHISSMRSAISRIYHWAREQHLSEKKCRSSRAFIVTVMLVVHPFGSRYLASSAGIPISSRSR